MGEEVGGYLVAGREPIICFEPQEVEWRHEGAVLVKLALGERDGKMTLRVPERIERDGWDTQMASGYNMIPSMGLRMGWTETRLDYLPVKMTRFDTWAESTGFVKGSCDLLVIDAQGMEMEVLRGFGGYLDGFSTLIVECAEEPCWYGQSSAAEVAGYLAARGFKQMTPIVPCGDVRFEKENDDTDL